MIKLHVFPSPWPFHPSPFRLKVETYCRLAGIEFDKVISLPLRAPRGKLPFYRRTGKNPDSALIISYLNGQLATSSIKGLMRRDALRAISFAAAARKAFISCFSIRAGSIRRDGKSSSRLCSVRHRRCYSRRRGGMARRNVSRALHGQGYGRLAPRKFMRTAPRIWKRSPFQCRQTVLPSANGRRPTTPRSMRSPPISLMRQWKHR